MSILSASNDLLHQICSNLGTSVASLGRLCCVSKFVKSYLYSGAARSLWFRTGQNICGKAYWPDDLDPFFPGGAAKYDAQYVAMLMLCPWRSKPYYIGVEQIRGVDCFLKSYGISWMNVAGATYDEKRIVVEVSINSNQVLLSKEAKRPDADKRTKRWEPCSRDYSREEYNQFNHAPPPPSLEEYELMLRLNDQEWRPLGLYPGSSVRRVFVVHDSLLCIVCHGDESSSSDAYFVSSKTMRVLNAVSGGFRSDIVIQAASIWTFEHYDSQVRCIVPRGDKSTADRYELLHESEYELWEIYRAALRGDMEYVFSTIEAKSCYPYELIRAIARSGPLDVLAALLKRCPDSYSTQISLGSAVKAGRFDATRLLIEQKADPSDGYSSVLHSALISEKVSCEMVQLLLDSGASMKEFREHTMFSLFLGEDMPHDVKDLIRRELDS